MAAWSLSLFTRLNSKSHWNLILVLGLLIIIGCEADDFNLDNPLDPKNPEFIPPEVSITSGPSNDDVISTSYTKFNWEGNRPFMLFKYAFDGEWTEWTDQKSVEFSFLDEGDHSFLIKSTYTTETGDTSGHESELLTVEFEVDAVEGPAIMFYPRRHISSAGQTVTFQVLAEEVENLTAAEFKIEYDTRRLIIQSISQGDVFLGSGESLFHVEIDSLNGEFSILTGMLGGNTPSFSGTSNLLSVEVKIIEAVQTELNFDESEVFRDPDNNTISINETVNGRIETK